MPYGDRTGPDGFGPRTGRGAGFCSGYPVPGYMNDAVPRRGLGRRGFYGRGRGMGRRFGGGYGGWGPGYYAPFPYPAPAPYPTGAGAPDEAYYGNEADELSYLKSRLEYLDRDSEALKKRIEELESDSGDDKA